MLLQQLKQGDESARDRLFITLQSELRDMAGALMRRERPDHTLQATALVNEACIKLLDSDAFSNVSDRRYMFGMANRAMRQILVDHARRRRTDKRGGEFQRASLDIVLDNFESQNQCQFEELEAALESLEAVNSRLKDGGITLHLSEVKGPVMDQLKRSHFLDELTGKVHLTQFDAVSSINPELARHTLQTKQEKN